MKEIDKKQRKLNANRANRLKLAIAAAIAPGILGAKAKKAMIHSDLRHNDLKVAEKGIRANRRRVINNRGNFRDLRISVSAFIAT